MPPPVTYINGKKYFTMLENNPEVFNPLAQKLGLSPTLSFIDIYTLSPDYLSTIPRPIHALLVIIPFTPTWGTDRTTEDATMSTYTQRGPDEEILWFKQTIGDACGSIGLLHCVLSGTARKHVVPGSAFDRIAKAAEPLGMGERAEMLYADEEFEVAHQSVAELGDSRVELVEEEGRKSGQHFVAYVRGEDGRLWELEGGRKGPICRGVLAEGEDLLCERAVGLGIGRVIELARKGGEGNQRFSVLALVEGVEGIK